jgi:hypothetical protein
MAYRAIANIMLNLCKGKNRLFKFMPAVINQTFTSFHLPLLKIIIQIIASSASEIPMAK